MRVETLNLNFKKKWQNILLIGEKVVSLQAEVYVTN